MDYHFRETVMSKFGFNLTTITLSIIKKVHFSHLCMYLCMYLCTHISHNLYQNFNSKTSAAI